jgi:predicted GNAT family N-acyltransferase
MHELRIQAIKAHETYNLRHQVLRPHQTPDTCALPLDLAPKSYHIGCFYQHQLIGVGSVFQEAPVHYPQANSWRIRGMAVQAEGRRNGVGGKILQELIAYAATQGLPGQIWCHGRLSARDFYRRFGFIQRGEIFELAYIGPHVLLIRPLLESDLQLKQG